MKLNKQQRRVLLVEPNYKNKYPPLGLMKLATYHRNRGDYVRFFKGEFKDLISDVYADEAIKKFYSSRFNHALAIDISLPFIALFVIGTLCQRTRLRDSIQSLAPAIASWLKYYATAYNRGKVLECVTWDRILCYDSFHILFQKNY